MSVFDRPETVSGIPRARIYRRPNSSSLWFSYLNDKGQLVRRSAGTDKRPDAWAALLRDYQNQHELKFEDAVVIFFEKREIELKPNTLRQYAYAVQAMRPKFEGKLLRDISPKEVRSYIDERRAAVSDATVKRELAFLSGLYTFLIEEEDHTSLDNPVRKVKKKRLKEVSRTRYLTKEEYGRLLAACTSDVHVDVVKTAVMTGMRHGELLDFEKSWIKWNLHEIHLPAEFTKADKERIIPMSVELEETLRHRCASTECAHVFCYLDRETQTHVPFTTFKNFFYAARRRAGLKDLRFHDLRHTFGSWWAQADGNLLALKDVMGHSTVKVTERYSHVNTNTLHRVRRQVDEHTEGTLTRFLKSNPRRKK